MATSIDLLIQAVNNAKTVVDQAAKDLGAISKEATAVGDKSEAGAKKAEAALTRLKNTAIEVKKQYKGLTDTLGVIGEISKKMLMAGAAITAAVFFPIKEAADLQSALLKIRLASGASREEIKDLSAAIKDLDNKTNFTALQFAQASLVLSKFGMKVDEIKRQLPGLWQAAYAGNIDISSLTTSLTGVLSGMGIGFDEISMRAAQFAVVAKKTNVDMLSLVEGVRELGPVAQASGTSLEDLLTMFGVLGKMGETAPSTSLFKMLNSLQEQSNDARKALVELNVSTLTEQGVFKGMLPILEELSQKNMTVAQATDIFGARVGKLAIALTSNKAAFREFRGEIDNAEASIKKASELMKEDARLAFTRLLKTFSDVGEKLAAPLIPPITAVLNAISSLLELFMKFIDVLGPVGPTIFGVVTALGVLLVGLGTIGIAIKTVGTLFVGLKVGLATMGIVSASTSVSLGILTTVLGALKVALATIAPVVLIFIGALALYKILSEWKGFLNVFETAMQYVLRFKDKAVLWFKEIQLAWRKLWGQNTEDLEKEIEAQKKVVKTWDDVTKTFKKYGDAKEEGSKKATDAVNAELSAETKAAAAQKALADKAAIEKAQRTKYEKELADANLAANVEREKASVAAERTILQAKYSARLIQHEQYFKEMEALQTRETAAQLKLLQDQLDKLGTLPTTKVQRIKLEAEIANVKVQESAAKETLRAQANQVMKEYWKEIKLVQSKEQIEAEANLIKGEKEALENANKEKLLATDEYYTQLIALEQRSTANRVEAIRSELQGLDPYFDKVKIMDIFIRITGEQAAGKQIVDGLQSTWRVAQRDTAIGVQQLSKDLASQWASLSAISQDQIILKQKKELEGYDKETAIILSNLNLRRNEFQKTSDFEERLNDQIAVREEGRRRVERQQSQDLFDFQMGLEKQKLELKLQTLDQTTEGEKQAFVIREQLAAIEDATMRQNLIAKGISTGEIDQVIEDQQKASRLRLYEFNKQMTIKELQMHSEAFGMMGEMFGNMYELTGKKIKAFFYLQKAAALAQAIVNVAEGITKTLGMLGPFGIPMSAIVAAAGAVQIATIASQAIYGYAKGGLIPGLSRRKDDRLAAVTAGEFIVRPEVVRRQGVLAFLDALNKGLVDVPTDWWKKIKFAPITPRLAYATGGMVPDASVKLGGSPLTIMNVIDPREIDRAVSRYMYSSLGEDAVINVISSRADTVKKRLR